MTMTTPCSRTISRWYLAVLCLLLPLKFGISINNSEIAFFPLSLAEWWLTPWPPFLLPALSGLGLFMVAVHADAVCLRRRQLWALAGLAALIFAGLAGIVNTTERDYAQLFLWHLLGSAALGLAAMLQLHADPKAKKILLAAMAAGAILAALSGWQQIVGGGYAATAEYVQTSGAQADAPMSAEILSRLERGRASGPFVIPNSFAAHLLLTIPLSVVLLWRAGRHFSPARLSCPLLGGVALTVLAGAFFLTFSRAAVVAAVGGGAVVLATVMLQSRHRRRTALLIGAAAVGAGAVVLLAVNQGRGISSLSARGHYYLAGLDMFRRHPFAGVGLGEFFPWYIRLKPAAAEATRFPHSVLILFLSQCGIAGGLAVVGWGVASLRALIPPRIGTAARDPLALALLGGASAWLIHSLVDFNFQIPGTVATFAVVLAIGSGGEDAAAPRQADRRTGNLLRQAGAVALAVVCFAGVWRWPGENAYQRLYNCVDLPESSWEDCRALAELAREHLIFSPYPDILLAKRATFEKRLPDAEKALSRALRRAPHRGGLWHALAATRAALGDHEGAKAAYREATIWLPPG